MNVLHIEELLEDTDRIVDSLMTLEEYPETLAEMLARLDIDDRRVSTRRQE